MLQQWAWAFLESAAFPAMITGVFGLLAVYLRKFNKDNTKQHEESMERREQGHNENMRLRLESRTRLEDIIERIDSVKEDVKEVKQDLNVRIDEVREDVKEVNIDIDTRVDEVSQRINEIRDDIKEVRENYASEVRVEELGERIDDVREDLKEVRENQQRHVEWHAQSGD